ncbi:MAG: hypothetical protein M3O01_13265 [Pseudomonadota bacterium]|nr:hypothetical protein [Pseudomonadota bacterium]
MLARQVPSSDMLHSVGALMDTSFIRAAVADAEEVSRSRPAGSEQVAFRFATWLRVALARLAATAPKRAGRLS